MSEINHLSNPQPGDVFQGTEFWILVDYCDPFTVAFVTSRGGKGSHSYRDGFERDMKRRGMKFVKTISVPPFAKRSKDNQWDSLALLLDEMVTP